MLNNVDYSTDNVILDLNNGSTIYIDETPTLKILSDLEVDNLIEEYKTEQEELERLEQLEKQKIEQVKFNSETVKKRVRNKIQFLEDTLKFNLMNSENKQETKTLYKKKYISGEIQVKKAHQKIANPNLKGEDAFKIDAFKSYCEKVISYKFNWGELKKKLSIVSGNNVFNAETGELLTGIVSIEEVPEEVIIK